MRPKLFVDSDLGFRFNLRWCAVAARIASACGLALTLVVGLTPRAVRGQAREQQAPAGTTALGDVSRSLEAMIERVCPAIVKIYVSAFAPQAGIVDDTSELLGRQRSTGSGVILDADGFIVTNAHVVAGARRIQVLIPHSREALAERRSVLKDPGELIGAHIVGLDRETDLAVLKVEKRGLQTLRLVDSETVREGQLVFAFGSPLGLANSVSMGVVSAVARQLRSEDPMIYIQTDASINPGNSGGPLVNAAGDVVGINTLILSQSGGSEGIGFAAPSNIVRNVFEQLRAQGTVRRGTIGVYAQTITPLLGQGLGLQRSWGVILGDVFPQSPAERAGLRPGDIVVALNGKTMENGRQLDVNLYNQAIGQKVALDVLRDGKPQRFDVQVVERPDAANALLALVSPERNLIAELGVLVLDYDARIAAHLPPTRHRDGVVVAGRAADAPFWEEGLLPGDVMHAVNSKPVRSVDELRREIRALRLYDAVVVQVERNGQLQYVAFERE